MYFTDVNEIIPVIDRGLSQATEIVRDRVHNTIHEYILRFYFEFDPSMYARSYQLFNALIKTNVTKTANGYEAQVQFDWSQMDHTFNYLGFGGGGNWSEEMIGKTAATGKKPHGGYAGGTKIWTNPIAKIRGSQMQLFKQALLSAGIDVI